MDLVTVIQETYEIIRRSFDKMIDIRIDLPNLLPIQGDDSGLSQAFMNLFTNARDAMPEGGSLSIRGIRKGSEAVITVSDSGVGMDEDIREKCFDPFFTTKEVDKGTGLGLSTTYGIIKDHGGRIEVQSKRGEGTTFHLFFPLADMQGPANPDSSPDMVSGKGQKILIVDDEIDMFKALEELITGLGYQTRFVSNGSQALEVYKFWHPDAVLLDRNMPEMSGIVCAQRLMDYDPKARIILISGYDEYGADGIDEQMRSRIMGYLKKPLDIRELSRLLALVLSSHPKTGS
jgi:CheY-like chemotaxis protein